MSRSRRFFESNDDQAQRGPSDEMLAVDAASEMRSMTLLYERWADRLYRYFLLSTADPEIAERMMRDLIARLPEDLQLFAGQDRSFGGWLFSRASEVFWHEYSPVSRLSRHLSRYIPSRTPDDHDPTAGPVNDQPVVGEFDEIAAALAQVPADRREVLGIHFGARLKTVSASEALRVPASLMPSHIQWALQSLGEHLDVQNTRRLSEDLSDVIQRESLSQQARQHHFSLINGVFAGEVDVETGEPERTPIVEIGALVGVVIVGLLGIWIWGLITEGDTRQHDVASQPEAGISSDDSDPTPTPEPSPTGEATDEAVTATDDDNDDGADATCMAADGEAQFDRFVRHFNAGDFDGLEAMLPVAEDDRDEDSTPVMVTDTLLHHAGRILNDSDSALAFLEERHEAGERWDVLQALPAQHYGHRRESVPIEMYQDWIQEDPDLSIIIVSGLDWSGADEPRALAAGRAVFNCESEELVSWDMQARTEQHTAEVNAADFVSVMDDLQEGESRSIRARVNVDSRPDGGALSLWDIYWTEAVLNDGSSVEHAEVTNVDGEPLIRYVNDGERWQIDQRGWPLFGDTGDEVDLPDEIDMVVPWFSEVATVLGDFSGRVDDVASLRIAEDYTDDELGARERELGLTISSGIIQSVEVLENTSNDTHLRPEFQILSANRSDDVDESLFALEEEPQFPEIERSEQRYDIDDRIHDKLDLISMSVTDDQTEELYRIAWNDVEMDLYVRPSRGGLDPDSVAQSIDDSWTNAHSEYNWGILVWAYRHFAGYPTDAIWDDGHYLFVISVDPDNVSAEHDWDLDELIELANTLSADQD